MRALRAGWLLLTTCSAPAPIAPAPSPVTVAPPARAVSRASATPASPVVVGAVPEITVAPASPAAPALAPVVLLEPAYPALGHLALATEMQTLERDEELFHWALGGSSDPQHPSNQAGYHPATRVVVDVELLSRAPKGTSKRLLRIARSSGYWPLRACFEAAQRLGTKSERAARVRLTLSALGKVLGARSVGKRADAAYERCVLARLRNLDFRPGFTRKLDVEIDVKQWPGHAPVPPRAPEGAAVVRLSPETNASLSALVPALASCYAQGLATDTRLWGRIAFRLSVEADGAIREAMPVETRFPNTDVVDCTRQAVLGARLVSPQLSEFTLAFRLGQPPPPEPPSPEGAPASPKPPPPPEPPAPPEPVH